MTATELGEFIENEYELLEDEEWDNFSLMNGCEFCALATKIN